MNFLESMTAHLERDSGLWGGVQCFGEYALALTAKVSALITRQQSVGTCLVFPIWWNVILTVLVVICFVLKTTGEDRHILRLISGYEEYTSKVPYLLIPGIW